PHPRRGAARDGAAGADRRAREGAGRRGRGRRRRAPDAGLPLPADRLHRRGRCRGEAGEPEEGTVPLARRDGTGGGEGALDGQPGSARDREGLRVRVQQPGRRHARAAARPGRHRPRAREGRTPPMTTEARLARARRVLDVERRALAALGERLDWRLARAIDLLLACRGRVIVTGVGKSGIVCRKIAATLTSTGTPAFFLHAGEGSHGDLGTLVRGDVLLAVSNSGESAEVLSLLRVEEIMHRGGEVPLVPERAALKDTLVEITSKRLGVTGVVNGVGELVGVITDGDLRRGLERAVDLGRLTACDLMTTAPKTI